MMIRQICAGLSYLHEKDVAHCDIKSHNVLLHLPEPDQSNINYASIIAKLSDFGLSLIKSETETSMSHVEQFRNLGTPRYYAPEVHRGELMERDQYMKADIFSMGILMTEVATEEEPYNELKLTQLRTQVGEKGMLPTISGDTELDERFVSQLHKCGKFHPDERPTAKELLQSMKNVQKLIII